MSSSYEERDYLNGQIEHLNTALQYQAEQLTARITEREQAYEDALGIIQEQGIEIDRLKELLASPHAFCNCSDYEKADRPCVFCAGIPGRRRAAASVITRFHNEAPWFKKWHEMHLKALEAADKPEGG